MKLSLDPKLARQSPTYFIADIAANHDGNLERAKHLIFLAAESGANAAKFQHFSAENIVSDYGFRSLGNKKSHQANWKKSVFDIYRDASISQHWTEILKKTCDQAGITFFTSPYSFDLVDHIDPYVPAYKVGSGDITWIEMIEYIASRNKPYIIATGASSMDDVLRAVEAGLRINTSLCLMQCNTNYTASLENFKFINLNVLQKYKKIFPNVILGLSDHTPGMATALGAVALGAKMIEKHFTDDVTREGPDHKFSMDPLTWKDMVDRTRELENALGGDLKKIEENELDTAILQRRAIRASINLEKGRVLLREDLSVLRPCPPDGIQPYRLSELIGKKISNSIIKGDCIRWTDIE